MGDFRFSFKAEFSMGDVEDKCDMWLNWSPGEDVAIDQRVLDWLRRNFEAGETSIRDGIYEGQREAREREEEKQEREEFERLKKKFAPNNQP